MTLYLAAVPTNKFRKAQFFEVKNNDPELFWDFYDYVLAEQIDNIASGSLAITAFDAVDLPHAVGRVYADFRLKRRKFEHTVITDYPNDDVRSRRYHASGIAADNTTPHAPSAHRRNDQANEDWDRIPVADEHDLTDEDLF